MRAKRVALALAMVATGAVIARPDDVLPLATKLAAPLLVHRDAAPGETVAPSLPKFVNTPHELAFPSDAAAPARAPVEAAETSPDVSAGNDPAADTAAAAAVDAAPPAAQIAPMLPDEPVTLAATQPANAKDAGAPPAAGVTASPDETKADQTGSGETATPAGKKIIAAKTLFGAAKKPSLLQSRSIGSYSRGCLAGAVALPVNGPAWQAMRLSRNRNWGHPKLIDMVEDFAVASQKLDGWPGLLVGDISQPRGGPMLTGHASHQLGLDADIWLTPMPDRKLTNDERENIAATSMLDGSDLAVDQKVFTERQVKLIKRAASYPEVERVLVHPAIKKALCQAAGTDRAWLGKVRPIQGHYYHMHIRIGCPRGSAGCVPQKATTGEDGCGKEVDEWLQRLARDKLPEPPKPPGWKPSPPKPPLDDGAAAARLPHGARKRQGRRQGAGGSHDGDGAFQAHQERCEGVEQCHLAPRQGPPRRALGAGPEVS